MRKLVFAVVLAVMPVPILAQTGHPAPSVDTTVRISGYVMSLPYSSITFHPDGSATANGPNGGSFFTWTAEEAPDYALTVYMARVLKRN